MVNVGAVGPSVRGPRLVSVGWDGGPRSVVIARGDHAGPFDTAAPVMGCSQSAPDSQWAQKHGAPPAVSVDCGPGWLVAGCRR